MGMVIAFICEAICIGMTLLYGSTGEIITEKSGHLNLGIPGIMCVGAASGCYAEALYIKSLSNPSDMNGFLVVVIGLLASIFGSAVMGLIYCFFTDTLRANQNVTGLVLTTFGVGLTKFIISLEGQDSFSGASGAFKAQLPFVEPLKEYLLTLSFGKPITWIVDIFLSHGILIYLALAIAIVSAIVLKRTKLGLHLRAVGENPAAADAVGINVTAYRYVSTCIGSAIAGLGGFCFIMDNLNGMWEYAIDAMGWLAIALVIFSVWKPNVAIFGSILFGGLYIVVEHIKIREILMPIFELVKYSANDEFLVDLGIKLKPLFKMLPYLVTIIVLIITSIRDKKENHPPASLGLSYFREDR